MFNAYVMLFYICWYVSQSCIDFHGLVAVVCRTNLLKHLNSSNLLYALSFIASHCY